MTIPFKTVLESIIWKRAVRQGGISRIYLMEFTVTSHNIGSITPNVLSAEVFGVINPMASEFHQTS